MRRWAAPGSALLRVLCIALIPIVMLGGAYAGVVLGHKLAEPDHQSAFERRVQAPGDDPHYVFAGLLGAVIGFVVAGLLVMLLYAWFLARREREGGRRTEDRSNDL